MRKELRVNNGGEKVVRAVRGGREAGAGGERRVCAHPPCTWTPGLGALAPRWIRGLFHVSLLWLFSSGETVPELVFRGEGTDAALSDGEETFSELTLEQHQDPRAPFP